MQHIHAALKEIETATQDAMQAMLAVDTIAMTYLSVADESDPAREALENIREAARKGFNSLTGAE